MRDLFLKERQKILLVTDVFPPKIGGPATFIPRLAENIVEHYGYRVTVLCSSDTPSDEADRSRPYVIRRLYQRNSLRYKLEARQLLARALLTHDSVLVNGLESFVYQVSRILRRPYIIKIVGDSVWEMARNTGITLLDFDDFQANLVEQNKFAVAIRNRNRQVSFARHIVTPSRYLKQVVVGWGFQPDHVTVIPNGVELSRFPQSFFEARSAGDPFQILFVGRLTNWKGVETLLLAARQMKNAHVIIVGDGPEYPHLVDLARQLEVASQIEFAGRLSPLEVEQRMAAAHVLVLTSLYEGMSHTLLEAMAAGLPCIASSRGGNPELIDSGDNGILVEPQNVRQLTGALKLLEGDESLRASISQKARANIVNYDMEQMARRYTELLIEQ